jgi:superfamily II DNA or RNA helicase
MQPGSIVQCRQREWVLLPADNEDVYLLRPLTGTIDDAVAVHKALSERVASRLAHERVRPARFPVPASKDLNPNANAVNSWLLYQAARLVLREGATPFRSLGRISIRPRIYQFVPLLMALRLKPVRMLIADDVGVGKTIEAILIARELFDRGEIRRICVLCPPYLCDQWQKELEEKFNLDAVVVRSGTLGRLESRLPSETLIYKYYPIQVISIDFIKQPQYRDQFVQHGPEFVIVDEAHGAAQSSSQNQQQRHELLKKLAEKPDRHLVLLTATPHSGIAEAFRSLLSLLNPAFSDYDVANLTGPQRVELAKHLVQRTRKDIEQTWNETHSFPTRLREETAYQLSPEYRTLFEKTYAFCKELVQTGATMAQHKQRVRYWGALALLRCVMSSPQAAIATIEQRLNNPTQLPEDDALLPQAYEGYIYESSDDVTNDEQPTPPVEATEQTLADSERRKLLELKRLAQALHRDLNKDTKLHKCLNIVEQLLRQGYAPIIWCRYVATAEYVAEMLQQALAKTLPTAHVLCITGRQNDEERRALINDVVVDQPHVLVATDCLSEGINLQEKYNAVLHYDLPWNPNRLEQREGRVDRYGQPSRTVKAISYYGQDNPIDGVVLEVLLRKADEIYRTLGTHVPVPMETETVMEAVLKALFMRSSSASSQLTLDLDLLASVPQVGYLQKAWQERADNERVSRTRFAQHALRPEEVERELRAADAVLGDPDTVRKFVLNAAQQLGLQIQPEANGGTYRIPLSAANETHVPQPVRDVIRASKAQGAFWRISFVSPTPKGAEYVGRNHPLVSEMARYLFEQAISSSSTSPAGRIGVIRTDAVSRLTTLLLLRVRYLMKVPQGPEQLAEEVRVMGYSGAIRREGIGLQWLTTEQALQLLEQAQPRANLSLEEKRELVDFVLETIPAVLQELQPHLLRRAEELEAAHKRIRQPLDLPIRGLTLAPQQPPDLLGLFILQPYVAH